jgi:hypothetical protein
MNERVGNLKKVEFLARSFSGNPIHSFMSCFLKMMLHIALPSPARFRK